MRRLLMSGVAVAAMVAFGSIAGAQQQQPVQPMPSQGGGASTTAPATGGTTGGGASVETQGSGKATTGAAEETQPGTTKKKSSETTQKNSGTMQKQTEQTQGGTTKKTQAGEETSGATGATGKASKVDIPEEKRPQVAKSFSAHKVKPAKIDVDVSIGVAIPRTVVLHPVPADIVEIVPAFRHYRYFVLANGEIVIVDPVTFVVVYVLTV
jgi:Protein of unknown function (DUF1236)